MLKKLSKYKHLAKTGFFECYIAIYVVLWFL